MLSFNWPREWNKEFVDSLIKKIETSIHAQIVKNKKLSFINGSPAVSKLGLGSHPPRLTLTHIHCLTPNRIALSVAFEYGGDACIGLKGVSFNLDTTTTGVMPPAPHEKKQTGGSNNAKSESPSDIVGDSNHSLPFMIPIEVRLENLFLAGSVDIEITQSFVDSKTFFTFRQGITKHADTLKATETATPQKTHKTENKLNKKKKAKVCTMPLLVMAQSLSYTTPSIKTVVSSETLSIVKAEASAIQNGYPISSNGVRPSMDTHCSSSLDQAQSDSGESDSLAFGHSMRKVVASVNVSNRSGALRPSFSRPFAPLSLSNSTRVAYTITNTTLVRGSTCGLGLGMRGRAGIVVRRPDELEVRTGRISQKTLQSQHDIYGLQRQSSDTFPGRSSADSPSTTAVTPRGGHGVSTRAARGRDAGDIEKSVKIILQVLWFQFKHYWDFSKPWENLSQNRGQEVFSTLPSHTVKSFLDVFAFKRFVRLSKMTIPMSGQDTSSCSKPSIVGGTAVKILFFKDPTITFKLQTNFTAIGVDKKLEELVVSKVLRPAIEMLLAEGLSFVV